MKNEIVFSGFGVLCGGGFGKDAIWEGSRSGSAVTKDLKSFPVMKHLSDRKLMKVMSLADAYGIAAFEQAMAGARISKGNIDPWKLGIYVGAQPSRVADNDPYKDPIFQTRREDGSYDEMEFGTTLQGAKPTTLLQGLPNNVLCYSAILCDGRGPNSNYTCGEVSSLVALINAAKRLQRGKIDVAFAGGYAAQLDLVSESMYRQWGWFAGQSQPLGDGAAFAVLETQLRARGRNQASALSWGGGGLGSRGSGSPEGAVRLAVGLSLQDAGLSPREVGLVIVSGSGIDRVDQIERKALTEVFETWNEVPVVCSSGWSGNLMEVGGLFEIPFLPELREEVPYTWLASEFKEVCGRSWQKDRPWALVLRSTPFGESAAVLIRICE